MSDDGAKERTLLSRFLDQVRGPGAPTPSLPMQEVAMRVRTAAGIESFCKDRTRENVYLDFKLCAAGYMATDTKGERKARRRKLPAKDQPPETGKCYCEKGILDLLKDVSSFANSCGGFIVLGVRDGGACAEEAVPMVDHRRMIGPLASRVTPQLGEHNPRLSPPLSRVDFIPIDSASNGTSGYIVIHIPQRSEGTLIGVAHACGAETEHHFRVGDRTMRLRTPEAELLRALPVGARYEPRTDPLWWIGFRLPDVLTLARPILGAASALLIIVTDYRSAFWVYYVALWTDILDGAFARAIARVTSYGKDFDRVADMACNFLVGAALALDAWQHRRVSAVHGGVALMVAYAISSYWIRPHSIAAKLRSGIVRALLLPFFVAVFLDSPRLAAWLAVAGLGFVSAVYEGNVLADEYRDRAARRQAGAPDRIGDLLHPPGQ